MEQKRLIWVYNIHKQNYLEEHGILPEVEDMVSSAAGYKNTEKFRKVLDRYYIQASLFKNRM